ncbi:MAG: SDR family NAD(P)-dependent oxidoreductase, partial [Proteobacteria bacterium]|nr:SDR family NAD(P)-dependent oxidoreductase [Pseudomonadota bacterium]
GARVLMVCRNYDKGLRVIKEFSEGLGELAASRCEVIDCELSEIDSVSFLIERVIQRSITVDFVFLNAGVFGLPFQLTKEKNEYTYATNYLSHFYLVHELLSKRVIALDGKIIATISEGAYKNPFARANLRMLSDPEGLAGRSLMQKTISKTMASPNSKIFLLLMLIYLSEKIKDSEYENLKLHGGDPGGTLTDNVNQMGPIVKALKPIYAPLLLKPVDRGAAVLIYLALLSDLGDKNACLFNHRLDEVMIPHSLDYKLAEKAWEISETRLNLAPLKLRPKSQSGEVSTLS